MKYKIIEDCSPYYIRFTYDGMIEFNEYALGVYNNFPWRNKNPTFRHSMLPPDIGAEVLSKAPLTEELNFNPNRVSFFYTPPNLYYRAHKDGVDHRFSINHTVKILDDKCITSWYSDEVGKDYSIDYLNGASRELTGFVKEKHTPIKSMVAQQNECILFNTEIFHDWDNINSSNERIVLTFRSITPGSVYYDDVKQILFKGQ